MRRRHTLLALVLAGLSLSSCGILNALLPRERLDDEDYRFRLEQPSRRWKMMSEEEVQKLVPDAAAGMMNDRDKLVAVVIVERAPDAALEPMVRAIVDSAPLAKKAVTHFDPVKLGDTDAIRYLMTGEVNDISYRYANTVFLHQDHLYQIIAWGAVDDTAADGSSFESVWRAFELLDGQVQGRVFARPIPDVRGVGWRVIDGTFESAVYGLRLSPSSGWRVAVGTELDNLNESAEVALVRRAPQMTLLLIPERAPDADRAAIERDLMEQTASGLGPRCEDSDLKLKVGGQVLNLRCYHGPDGEPFQYYYGLLYHELFGIQVLAWLPRYRDVAHEQHLRTALAAIELLDVPTRAKLGDQLAALPDPQNRVGSAFALRRGVYTDFEHGFTWTKPQGFWRLRVGDEARAVDEKARYALEHPATGVWGLLVNTAGAETAAEYHAQVREGILPGSPTASPRAVALGDAEALVSELTSGELEVPFTYRVATVLHADRGYQLLLWGTPTNMRAASDQLDAAVSGWRFADAGLPLFIVTAGLYQDLRMGWALQLPDKPWRFSDLTGDNVRALGSTVQWQHAGISIVVSSICAVQEGQDESWYLDQITRIYADHLGGALSGRPERGHSALDGVEALHMRWRGRDGVDAYVASRDKTIYALIITQEGVALDWPLEEVLQGFRFVD